jgi:hypothetical protein
MSQVKIVKELSDIPENELNLCIVVKVPKSGYKDSYEHCNPKDLGLNVSRWKYVSHIHVMMPNLWQLNLFQSLEWKHYHCDRDTPEKAVEASKLNINLCAYLPTLH